MALNPSNSRNLEQLALTGLNTFSGDCGLDPLALPMFISNTELTIYSDCCEGSAILKHGSI